MQVAPLNKQQARRALSSSRPVQVHAVARYAARSSAALHPFPRSRRLSKAALSACATHLRMLHTTHLHRRCWQPRAQLRLPPCTTVRHRSRQIMEWLLLNGAAESLNRSSV